MKFTTLGAAALAAGSSRRAAAARAGRGRPVRAGALLAAAALAVGMSACGSSGSSSGGGNSSAPAGSTLAVRAVGPVRRGVAPAAPPLGNDIGSQTWVQRAISAIKKAGLALVANETLDLHATTFRTEAQKIVSAHPDAIMTEALGSADPTLFSEIKQLNGGKVIPIIGTSAAISPAFYTASASAIGASTFSANVHADNLVTATSGPAYDAFTKALLAVKGKVNGAQTGNFTTYFTAPGAVHLYDGINLAALAMVAAHSTDTAVWKPWIATIGDGVPGAVTVSSFAQRVADLKAGKKIRYLGPGGPTSFDAFHDSPGIFQIDTYSPSGAVNVSGNITAAQLRSVSG